MKSFFRTYTNWIILINVFLFLVFSLLAGIFGQDAVFSNIALQPSSILSGEKLWTIITSMFMHGGVLHLLFNMFSLFFVGNFVERIVGKKRFLVFYILSGIFAGIFFSLVSGIFGNFVVGARLFGNPNIYGVGASGAIFGLIGLLAILTPYNKIYLVAGPLIAIIIQAILDSVIKNSAIVSVIDIVLTIYILSSIFFLFSFNPKLRKIALALEMSFWVLPIIAIVPLLIIGLFIELPIGNAAHIGGLLAGLIYGFYLKTKYPKKTMMISHMFSGRR
ncbi:MAG: rhomboid family intramembrane serine protease [bacterium]